MRTVIPFLFLTAILASAWSTSAAPPTEAELDLFLYSIQRRSDDVFVSNEAGIFRAELEHKKWEKLNLPAETPLGGRFGTVAVGSPQLLYYSNRARQQPGKVPGLYSSTDNGQTWQLVRASDEIDEVLMLSSGDLFVLLSKSPLISKSSIQMTSDLGKSWRDITGKSIGYVYAIFPDPDHPGLICVKTALVRMYILQAEDERYEWKSFRSWDWHPQSAKKLDLSRRYLAPSDDSPLHMINATLRNYFAFDFGSAVSIPAFDLRPEAGKFSFQLGKAVQIPITIRLLKDQNVGPASIDEKLLDHPTRLGVWGLSAELGNEQIHRPPAISAALRKISKDHLVARLHGEPERHSELEAEFIRSERKIEGWQTFEVSADKPYRRTLNLSRLYEFDEPGVYRVQLRYCSDDIGDRPGQGHWVGSFCSPVFTIEILPGE